MGIGPETHGRGLGLSGFEKGNGSGAFVNWYATRDAEFRDGMSHTILFSEKIIGDWDQSRLTPARDVLAAGMSINRLATAIGACLPVHGNPPDHNSFGGGTWLFAGYLDTWYNHVFAPNSPRPDCNQSSAVAGGGAATARSWHGGGVNVVFADGAARWISDKVDLDVWRALSTRAFGEVVSDGF
jgi:prepilin-type processing-associated H-X9-DG protein